MAKLTLSMDKQTIERAKELAAARDTSVSAMFARFIRFVASGKRPTGDVGPLTKKATGSMPLGGADYKDLLTDGLSEKYGRGS